MSETPSSALNFPEDERRVLEFWEQRGIFQRSLEQRAGRPRFVFYEGPPTANGMPHPGHCLTRAMKDLFPRYRSMCGYLVERKAGWDTHGLPVEREVEKELGLQGRADIERYGVERFVHRCMESVFRYTREWEEMTRRLGYWVDLKNAYATYHQSYVESVWWSLKTLFERGLLYQAHKVVWWWPQGGTALSAGEVGEGYRTVDDPSVYVKFPLNAAGAARVSLLVWTTTPWTLISNHFAAVNPELEYALVEDLGPTDARDAHTHASREAHVSPAEPEYLYIAAALVETIARKVQRELRIVSTCRGSDLVGLRYRPPFPEVYYDRPSVGETGVAGLRGEAEPGAGPVPGSAGPARFGDRTVVDLRGARRPVGWRVLAGEFVTIESGTGLVHEAPAFGEVDFELLQTERSQLAPGQEIPLLCAVNPDGTFNDEAPPRYRGRLVFDCDRDIIRELREERRTPWGTPLLYHQELYRHEYPFCPRAEEDRLIQYARRSWFVRTSPFKEEFLANSAAVNWLPAHIREGRMGDFLRHNVDWALSRERFWGTPLPIWVCEQTGRMEAIGSFDELRRKPGATDGGFWEQKCSEARARGEELSPHLRVHRPYIDAWTYDSPLAEPGPDGRRPRMRRVPEVIDCWWDAGSMPFAQWGFPHQPGSRELLDERFPADFISEAIDQTRGWFYGLLAISTLLFGPAAPSDERSGAVAVPRRPYPIPYRTCIVLGHVMGEDGLKMSKRARNYREPSYIFDTYGADAMRWYFFSAQAPWTSIRFQEAAIRDAQREFLVKIANLLSFFDIYARIDGFALRTDVPPGPERADPLAGLRGTAWRPVASRSELDRWIISELHRTTRTVREAMDRFENFPAAQRLAEFVDGLSNWYVRRSRERFWRPVTGHAPADQDKWDAYNTLGECLLTLSRLIAPFTPFIAETLYRSLAGAPLRAGSNEPADSDPAPGPPSRAAPAGHTVPATPGPMVGAHLPESVHLCDYPLPDDSLIDETLAERMQLVRAIVSLGRAARTQARIKVRQPLQRVEIVLARREHEPWLRAHAQLIAEELNVKQVEFVAQADPYVTYRVVPNFKALGARYRSLVPLIQQRLAGLADPAAAHRTLREHGVLPLEVAGQTLQLSSEEVEVRLEARPGWSAAQDGRAVVVISTEITPELRREGIVRELIHQVQMIRKAQNLPYQARIILHLAAPPELLTIVREGSATLRSECLVERIEPGVPAGQSAHPLDLEGWPVQIAIARV